MESNMKNFNTILAVGAVAAVCGAAEAGIIPLYSQNFDDMTTGSTSALPAGWRFAAASPTWSGTTTAAVTQNAGTTGTGAVAGSSSGGAYLWVNGVLASGTDKSIGFLSSNSYSSPRSIMMSYTNDTGNDLSSFTASWDYEKYRSGTRAFSWTFFASTDGTNWTAVTGGDQSYTSDANNTTVFNPPSTIAKSVEINQSVANGGTLYLRWTYTGNGGSSNGQGLSIDNFSLTAVPAPGAMALLGVAGLLGARRRR
jgi:MYXO-CTERM domain-containing protein